MRVDIALRAAIVLTLLAGAGPARAAAPDAPSTPVRIADHDTFGRVVFDLPKGAGFDVATEGDRSLIVFRGAGELVPPSGVPRNVASVRTGPNTATVVLKPGARLHTWRLGDRLLVDALDPTTRPQAAASISPPISPPAPSRLAARRAPAASPLVGHAPQPVAAVAPADAGVAKAPVAPVLQEPLAEVAAVAPAGGPAPAADAAAAPAPAVTVAGRDVTGPPPGGVLKAEPDVAAAAFRRGALGVMVLDRRIPMDPPPWLAEATVVLGAVSTVIQAPLRADQALSLARVASGWSVAVVDAVPERSLAPQPADEGLVFAAPRAGRVVAMLDPLSGSTLLVGANLASGPAAAVADRRRTPDYTVLPTWQGVVVEPSTDRVDLRAVTPGFVLSGAPPPPPAPLAVRGRRFDIPDEPIDALRNRMLAQLASAAAAAPRARTKDRMAAAQTMVALGMGLEAQTLMRLVAAEDPQAAADARVQALTGIAAVMAGRPDDAPGLDDTRLDDARLDDPHLNQTTPNEPRPDTTRTSAPDPAAPNEIVLWRGLRDLHRGLATPAVAHLSAQVALARAYPPTLGRLVWPDVAEAAVAAGTPVPIDALPPFAKAMLLEKQDKIAEAKAAYAALDAGSDRRDQVRAAARLTELRLAGGEINPAAAADAMERLSFAWRGDAREARFRRRAAELRVVAGGWRAALDSLREIETLFPEQKALVQARKASVFQAMLETQGSGMSPLDVVLLAADYADCVPDGPPGAALAALLADKLLALDLPARAIPVLQGLMRSAPPGPARAEFGRRLALLLLDGGDAAGAVATLQASDAPDAAPDVRESRALAMARALAEQGDLAAATSLLVKTGSAAADDLRATLQANAGDVQASLAALSDLAAKRVPAEGALSDAAQDVLMRQAAAAARVPDLALLRALERDAPRMTGPRADLFRVLTAPPLAATTELPRAAKELTLARVIPQRLQALGEK